jgi:hypothetical protein
VKGYRFTPERGRGDRVGAKGQIAAPGVDARSHCSLRHFQRRLTRRREALLIRGEGMNRRGAPLCARSLGRLYGTTRVAGAQRWCPYGPALPKRLRTSEYPVHPEPIHARAESERRNDGCAGQVQVTCHPERGVGIRKGTKDPRAVVGAAPRFVRRSFAPTRATALSLRMTGWVVWTVDPRYESALRFRD